MHRRRKRRGIEPVEARFLRFTLDCKRPRIGAMLDELEVFTEEPSSQECRPRKRRRQGHRLRGHTRTGRIQNARRNV
jgi:hypothetical protein